MSAPIKMDFVIDEDHLLMHTLTHIGYQVVQKDIDVLRYKASMISTNGYDFLLKKVLFSGAYSWEDPDAQTALDLREALKETAEFQCIVDQTKTGQDKIEQEWNANLEKSFEFMQQITGLPLDHTYTVFVTHPSLSNGRYYGNRQISWGGPLEFENDNTVYLWHEVLHDEEYLGINNNVNHAIIELLADNALRAHLNGESLEKLTGHSSLHEVRAAIYADDWQQYIKNPEKNILKFKSEMRKKYKKSCP